MRYCYHGWMRRTARDRWFQVVEADKYDVCWEFLYAFASRERLKVSGSLVVLAAGTVPAMAMPRRRK